MSIARLLRSVLLVAGACAPVVLVGCGPSAAEVSGTITYNGQQPKLKGLQILFIGKDGRQGSAAVAEDGAYKADAVPVGDAVGVAIIYTPIAAAPQPGAGHGKLPQPDKHPEIGPSMQPGANPIPEKLRDASTSDVTAKIESGKKNRFDFDIKP